MNNLWWVGDYLTWLTGTQSVHLNSVAWSFPTVFVYHLDHKLWSPEATGIHLIKSVRSDPIQLLIEQFLLQNWYKMWIHDKYWILETLLHWQCWKKQTHCCWVFWLPCLRHTQCHPEGDPTLFYRMYLLPPSTRAQHTSNAVIVKQWGAVILDVSYHYEIHCKAQAVSLILPCESRGI